MSDYSSNEDKKKAAIEAMITAINTQAPLPIDVIKQWMKVSELSIQAFADLMECNIATVKNWLCTYKKIPKRRENEVRQKIQMKISCDASFRAGAFSAAAAGNDQQEPTEEELTYKIDPRLYRILGRIAKISRRSVFQIISEAVYSWSGDLIERNVFTRPAIAVKKHNALIESINSLQKELKEWGKECEKTIEIYKRGRREFKGLAVKSAKQSVIEELKTLDAKIDAEEKNYKSLKESYHTLKELKDIMMEDLEGRPEIFIRKTRRLIRKNTHP